MNTAHSRTDGRYLRKGLEQIQLFGPAQVQGMRSAGPEQFYQAKLSLTLLTFIH